MLVPENPRAAQIAASGLAAMAMLGLHTEFGSAARERSGDVLREAEKAIEARRVERHGAGGGLLHRGRELEGQCA